MAANIRKIRAWRTLTAPGKARITRRARPPASLRDYVPTADGPPAPATSKPASPAGQPRLRPAAHQQDRRHPRPGQKVISAGARTRRHTKKRPPPEFCRYDTGSSVGNPLSSEGDLKPPSRGFFPRVVRSPAACSSAAKTGEISPASVRERGPDPVFRCVPPDSGISCGHTTGRWPTRVKHDCELPRGDRVEVSAIRSSYGRKGGLSTRVLREGAVRTVREEADRSG